MNLPVQHFPLRILSISHSCCQGLDYLPRGALRIFASTHTDIIIQALREREMNIPHSLSSHNLVIYTIEENISTHFL